MSNGDSANREELSFGPPKDSPGDRNNDTRGEILPTCADCGAFNPKSCSDHKAGCAYECKPPPDGDVPTGPGGDVPTGPGGDVPTGIEQKAVQPSGLTKDRGPTAAELRQNAIKTRTAVATCGYNVAYLHWQWCNVELLFEGGRKLPYKEAASYATIIYVKAWNAALNSAIAEGMVGPDKMCNAFAMAVGRALDIPYFKNLPWYEDHSANQIYEFLTKAAQSDASGWQELDANRVIQSQESHGDLEGLFVVGSAHSTGSGKNGHVALAVPADFPRVYSEGRTGPWAIDGKRAAGKPPKSFRASGLFYTDPPNQLTEPIWAVYRP